MVHLTARIEGGVPLRPSGGLTRREKKFGQIASDIGVQVVVANGFGKRVGAAVKSLYHLRKRSKNSSHHFPLNIALGFVNA